MLFPRSFQSEIEVLPAIYTLYWSRFGLNQESAHDKPDEPVPMEYWKNMRIIAFPIFAKSPNHWTLGILVNVLWQPNKAIQTKFDWVLLHFDSLPCNESSTANGILFAKFVVAMKGNKTIQCVDVPVPKQASHSNDCGLWPAHYLRTFLNDREFFISHCTSVRFSELDFHSPLLIFIRTFLGPAETALKLLRFGMQREAGG